MSLIVSATLVREEEPGHNVHTCHTIGAEVGGRSPGEGEGVGSPGGAARVGAGVGVEGRSTVGGKAVG